MLALHGALHDASASTTPLPVAHRQIAPPFLSTRYTSCPHRTSSSTLYRRDLKPANILYSSKYAGGVGIIIHKWGQMGVWIAPVWTEG